MPKISPRILTALIGIPLVLGLVWWGGDPFKIFVLALALIGLFLFELADIFVLITPKPGIISIYTSGCPKNTVNINTKPRANSNDKSNYINKMSL